ncbi:hypothetical protein [Catellatospora sichuanensis]|uniref:hypothetical protein n=1 Tax=Catellatospora sichuanensis TaxID=1969805 RepID=UPI001182D8C3|nr:hypothetical protein [Catellatospora sichuanensis]
MVISVHAFPWDVLGDDGFVDRFAQTGADAVTLAVSYHSTRAATPLHPTRRFVDARHAALYRPVREQAWAVRRLVPQAPDWTGTDDAAGEAATALRAAGIAVNAWIVLAHDTRLGLLHPDLTVLNCFGERYPYALCPAQAEVREHCVTLAGEALRDLPVDGVSLESCGQMGVAHIGCHEKTDGAYSPLVQRLLSICCCTACAASWAARGLDPEQVVAALRDAVRAETPLPEQTASALLAARHDATADMLAEVLAEVRRHAPDAPVTLHGHPDPWAVGPSPGLAPKVLPLVDRVLVPCWPTDPATAGLVSALAERVIVDAYVTVLPPTSPDRLSEHVARLREAGATRLSLYHLGLASAAFQPLLAALTKEFRS